MELDEGAKTQIRSDWENASHGEKTNALKTWAKMLNCDVSTIYACIKTGRQRRKGSYKTSGIEDVVKILFQIKKRPPEPMGEISTDQALKIGIDNGLISKDMGQISISTFNRVGRDLGLNKRKCRIQRFQAEYSNQLFHIDASQSEIFLVDRVLSDGDAVLKINLRPSKRYKNKSLKNPDRLRAWVYGGVDDFSGVVTARYVAAKGENAGDSLAFLCWAWAESGDKVFFGLPERLKADHGPLMKGKFSQDFLERLGIKLDGSVPGSKEAHGKIERSWRTQWQRFEKPYFCEADRKGFEILLSELNRRFLIFQAEENNRRHRYERGLTRLQVWKQISLRGGAVAIPENALSTVARRIERVVRPDGCFSLDGVTYEVKGLHDARIYVYQGLFDDERMVVQDKLTGKKYEVETFKPTPLDTFVGHKDSPHTKAVKAGEALQLKNTLYIDKEPGKVTHFPTRVREKRKIENPLDTEAYPSFAEAMSAFISLSGISLDKPDDYELVKKFIIEIGCSKRKIKEQAFKVQNELEKKGVIANG